MKNIFILLLSFTTVSGFSQNESKIDTVAVDLLDKMSSVIGELTSVTFNLETSTDVLNDLFENERQFGTHQVHMVGPDKMAVHSRGDKGNRAIWYNGELVTYYSFDENNYVTVEAPDNIITMIDSMNAKFGMKFPAADLFYPSLTDDVLNYFDNLKYLGMKVVDGEECFHVMSSNADTTFQLWISNTALFLPKRYLFIDKKNGYQQYQGTFTNWNINIDLPESMFNFSPPANAKLISILAKS
ncbi:DUF2092 domain-containing protein [Winogradskyella aurantia]|uniref:DUF2092 domain-containing protein n=1 Tax=Winogradskyella aurantia TaxID=1915063 RepID=A0A265V0L4_9FLAO|nr:DUF2092 domain-containing protein [Winogradskyella aurantia]OZV71089.1 hypothetical protein CA834_02960 [Winogradskyella aurantia]